MYYCNSSLHFSKMISTDCFLCNETVQLNRLWITKKRGDNHCKVTVFRLYQDLSASAHPTAPDIGHSCLASILPKLFKSYFETYYLLLKAAYLNDRSSDIIPQSSFLGLGHLKLVQLWSRCFG